MSRMVRIAVGALGVLWLTGCVSQEQYRRALNDSDSLRSHVAALSDELERMQGENQRLVRELERLSAGGAVDPAFERERQAALERMKALLEQGGDLPAGVRVREGAEGTVFDVQGEVLFASGRAEITEQGRATLGQLADRLIASGRRLRVEGHTDSDPIRNSAWRTNLRLSAERALVVAEFLIGAGVPEERVGISGYGQHRPTVEGSDAAAKAQNRRVEILVLDG